MFVLRLGKRAWIGLFLVSSVCGFLWAGAATQAQSKAQPPAPGDKAAELKKLLKERHDVLNEAMKRSLSTWELGLDTFLIVTQAQGQLLKACLEISEDPKERIAALQGFQKLAEQIVRIAEARRAVGFDGEANAGRARAMLLDAQIELLREELKGQSSKK